VIELSSRYPNEGGLYVWSKHAFGDFAGFMSAWTYWTCNLPYFPAVLYFAASNALFMRPGAWMHLSSDSTYYIIFSLTALAVVGRSGTAITAELATNTVLREVRALEGMGIDPNQYLVLPRVLGCIISVTILTVLFDAVALTSGFLAAGTQGMSGSRYIAAVLHSLNSTDVWVTLGKGMLSGLVIGIWASYHGLAIRRGPTEIPQAVIRSTVGSIVMIFVVSALFVVVQ